MSERVAIVVGAGGELGRATAQKLATAGFTVAGVYRSEEGLKELPDGIQREAADPTDPAAARSVVDRIAAEVGPPEVLVITIGTYHLGELLTVTPEDLRLMIDGNVGPALWLTQAVVPYLRERGSGSIVHVTARPGLQPTAGMAAYAVSKAALVHLTRVLELELRPLGIRVNAVAPQLLDTAKNRPYLTPDLPVDYPFEDTRVASEWSNRLDLPSAVREKMARGTVDQLLRLPRVQQLIAEPAYAHYSHYPDDIWADQALLDPNTPERSCVHLQNGDCHV